MAGKILKVLGAGLLGIVALGFTLYFINATPDALAIPADEAENPTRPYIVKLHAQWCPVCLMTKDEWAQIEELYGSRANLFVFDSTNEDSVARSQARAGDGWLGRILADYHGASGLIVLIDPRTRQVTDQLGGILTIAEYSAAIDKLLASSPLP